jgi:hypothetical protein
VTAIDRYTFIRLVAEQATPDGRAEAIAAIRAGLAAVAGLTRLTVGTPADDSASRWDVSVVARFATLDDLNAAMAGDAWRATFEDIAARAVVVKSWSFAVDER